uniref:Uncharacterized protein n=1 Tax=Rhizophora mucronata TaxID=61149 RepID=A0A2P2JCJ4_RHIMU
MTKIQTAQSFHATVVLCKCISEQIQLATDSQIELHPEHTFTMHQNSHVHWSILVETIETLIQPLTLCFNINTRMKHFQHSRI